jgi:hypothetical protein
MMIIGQLQGYTALFLLTLALGTSILFGIPLLFTPLAWAKILGWQISDSDHLSLYLGRCLGGLICVLSLMALIASVNHEVQPFFFQILISNYIILILIHIYGAIRRIQPLSETLEIGLWLGLLLLTLLFYPLG